MSDAITQELDDRQILTELALNERIITHPKFGKVRLRTPTLQIQRKIDEYQRSKKKFLKTATDQIVQEDGTVKIVPAYKSRELLIKEYKDLGWWTDEQETLLDDLNRQQMSIMTDLELLGFESDSEINDNLMSLRAELLSQFKDAMTDEISTAIFVITTAGTQNIEKYESVIKESASSTEIDTILEKTTIYRRQYQLYAQLAQLSLQVNRLQGELLSLVSDSWQEQLQYYTRLAQLYYCSSSAETGEALWPSLNALESEQNVDNVRILLGELNAFWQGWSEETREKIEKYSFTFRRNSEEVESTEELHVPPQSSKDGELPESEQTTSSKASDIQDPAQIIKSTSATT